MGEVQGRYIILDRDLKIPVPQWEKYKDRIERFKQVRIIPKRTYMTVEVVYDCVCSDNVGTGMASIDLGVNNLATLVCGCNALLFSGKVIKSYNRWFNKTLSMYIILDRDLKIPVPQWEKYKDRIERFKQVRIIPKRTYMTVEVVYDCVCSDNVGTGMASIDLGVNNLATLVCGCNALLFSGKVIKSYNRWFNKTLSMLQSIKDRQGIDKLTNRMRKMYEKRERFMNDAMHKTSRRIVDYLVSHHIGTLAVGYNKGWKQSVNKGWKQSVNMGGVNNQKFTFIPFARLRSCLRYKCELAGISYIEHEESYTSKCDALSMEDICKHDSYLGKRIKRGLFKSAKFTFIPFARLRSCLRYKCELAGISYIEHEESYTSKCDALSMEDICKHDSYLGKRVKRGLFKSAVGKVINADVNGALNIGRKVFGDSFMIADSGRWYRPERINVLKCV